MSKEKRDSNTSKINEKLNLVVMIPAYNEQDTIAKVIKEIPSPIPNISSIQILVIDDGSTDKTVEIAKQAGALIIQNKTNKGLGFTFKRGINEALKLQADIIVNIDADNQFNPKEIPRLIKPIMENKADMVTGSRFLKSSKTIGMPQIKKSGNRLFTNLISKITGKRFTDTQCGFRAYSREAALRLNLYGSFTYTQEVFIDLAEKGMKIMEVPVETKYYKKRKSIISNNLRRYSMRSLGIIARATRDTQPLTFFGLPGIFFTIIGLIGGLFSFIFWLIYLRTTPVRMLLYTSTFLFSLGLLLIILALIADMLKTIKRNQEEILYRLKKGEFGG